MRSISTKITMVLIVVSLVGALFTAFYIQNRTKNAFDKFIQDQDQLILTQALVDFYQTNGSWEDVNQIFSGTTVFYRSNGMGVNHPGRPIGRKGSAFPFVLATDSGLILAGGSNQSGYQPGDILSAKEIKQGIKLESEGELIGWLVIVPFPQPRNNTQQNFINTLQEGLVISSLVTLLIALILGGILIRSFTHPIRKLADATEIVAGGDLGYQVGIGSNDELGRLAASFNRMSADLEKADISRKQITADIAHDLRTPLSVLHGYTEAMSEGKLTGNPDLYKIMHQQALHLNYLIDDLRTLSLLDSNELSIHIQNIDPSITLGQIMAAFQPNSQEKEIKLNLEIMENPPRVNLDPDRLNQILGNLITNSLQVIKPGGNILLSLIQEEKNLVIKVSDNGPGIQKEHLPYIFNRFYRTDKSREADGKSSGLGLAITKKLVDAMGGTISVESVLGEGTTFSLYFPCS